MKSLGSGGHDGIIVQLAPNDDAKRMAEFFGGDQIIKFNDVEQVDEQAAKKEAKEAGVKFVGIQRPGPVILLNISNDSPIAESRGATFSVKPGESIAEARDRKLAEFRPQEEVRIHVTTQGDIEGEIKTPFFLTHDEKSAFGFFGVGTKPSRAFEVIERAKNPIMLDTPQKVTDFFEDINSISRNIKTKGVDKGHDVIIIPESARDPDTGAVPIIITPQSMVLDASAVEISTEITDRFIEEEDDVPETETQTETEQAETPSLLESVEQAEELGFDLHTIRTYTSDANARNAIKQFTNQNPDLKFSVLNQPIKGKDTFYVYSKGVVPTATDGTREVEVDEQVPEIDQSQIDFSNPVGALPDNFGELGYQVSPPDANQIREVISPDGQKLFARGVQLFGAKVEGQTGAGEEAVTSPSAPASPAPSPTISKFDNEILTDFSDDINGFLANYEIKLPANAFSAEDIADWIMTRVEGFAKKSGVTTKQFDEHAVAMQEELEQEIKTRLGDKLIEDDDGEAKIYGFPGNDKPHNVEPGTPLDVFADQIMEAPPIDLDLSEQAEVDTDPISTPAIMQQLEKLVHVTGSRAVFRIGRVGGKRRGIFKVQPEIMRIREANDVVGGSHEVGHALNKFVVASLAKEGSRVPTGVKVELIRLGKRLYGDRVPAGGYRQEGWAEFIRLLLTTDSEAQDRAPLTVQWFGKMLGNHKGLRQEINHTKELITKYRKQGALARASTFQVNQHNLKDVVRRNLNKDNFLKNWIEELLPLQRFVQQIELIKGEELSIEDNPFLTASALRHTHTSRTRYMVDGGMIDLSGNVVGPSLDEVKSIVDTKHKQEEFGWYLTYKRAQERWSKDKNPGIPKQDADSVVAYFEEHNPEFMVAAEKVYEWNRGVLNYALQGGLITEEQYVNILSESEYYVPFARIFDQPPSGTDASRLRALGADPFKTFRGSGRNIRDIFTVMIENAEKTVRRTHQKVVLNQVLKLRDVEGIGFKIEEIPQARVPAHLRLENLKSQLTQAGANLDEADLDSIISVYLPAQASAKDKEVMIPAFEEGVLRWFAMDSELYETLAGLDVYRLPKAVDWLLGVPTRAFRLGTTGLRAAFALVTNPARDINTFFLQTHSNKSVPVMAGAWIRSFAEITNPLVNSKALDMFRRLGGEMAQPLGIDTKPTRQAARTLYKGRVAKVVSSPIEMTRDFLQIPESATRATELRIRAKELGIDFSQPITYKQSLELLLDSKRVTTDFSAAGRYSKVINQMVPFFNANIQGARTFARAFKTNPVRSMFRGLVMLTIPTLTLWWKNKDEEWYSDMPYWERYTFWNVDDGETIYRIPRPFDWGNVFATIPEAMMDAYYRQDPRGATEAMQYILGTTNPADLPVLAKIAKEQWQNKVDFTDRPIVPLSQVELPPGEQLGPYTSQLAAFLGETFPDSLSPRRIDHGIRGFFGGLGPDLLDVVGLGAVKSDKEKEKSDFPVFGRLFRRGGREGTGSVAVGDLFDELEGHQTRRASERSKGIEEGRRDTLSRLILKDATSASSLLNVVKNHTRDLKTRETVAGNYA